MADYVERGPVRALGRGAPLIRFQISRYISCLLVYIVRFPTYPFFFTFFLVISSLENRYDTIRYDTRCYFNVRSKADISQLNLLHGTDN